MADLLPSGVDQTTGQNRELESDDELVDSSGNLLTQDSIRRLATTTITLSNTGNTALYIVPSGRIVLVSEVFVAIDTNTDITSPAEVSVGVSSSTDIVFGEALTGLTQTGRYYSLDVSSQAEIATAGSSIQFYVNTAATGAGSPSQTATVYLLGFEV